MTAEIIIGILVGLVLTAYGFIFGMFQKKIDSLEKRVICTPDKCMRRFDKIEEEQKEMNPLWMEIRERLAGIEAKIEIFLIERNK